MVHRFVARGPAFGLILALSACNSSANPDLFTPKPQPTARFPNIGYATWSDAEPPYRIVTVQADGRISLPLLEPVMVADQPIIDAEAVISGAYSSQLLRPRVNIDVKTPTPLKVFVGGEVDKPGVYDMPGDINALQAVIMAGGFKTSGRRSQVVIIRRGADGRAMLRTVNLVAGMTDPGRTGLVPLRRFDIVYVPRTGIAEVGLFVQQYLRDTLPIQLGFSYALGANGGVF
jgi:protein involved in polysaccharide export with SLBB domain